MNDELELKRKSGADSKLAMSRRLEDAVDVGTGREGSVESWTGCWDSFDVMLKS